MDEVKAKFDRIYGYHDLRTNTWVADVTPPCPLEAFMLLALILEHRAQCPGESCTISLSLLRPVYEHLIGRPVTDAETGYFA